MSLTMWVLSVVGVLGVGGTIAAAVMFPAVVIPILQAITASVLKCKPCLIALAIMASLFVGALYGANVEKTKCRAASLAAKLRNAQIDLEISTETARDAEKARAEIADRAAESEKKVADYAEQLKKRPNAACILTDDDFPDGLRKRSGAK